MRVPVLNLPAVYHIGTLDRSHRGRHHIPVSHEGACLSVSLCPEAWQQIAKLGGYPLHELARPDALFLDLQALGAEHRNRIANYAEDAGLAKRATAWFVTRWDDELEDWIPVFSGDKPSALQAAANVDDAEIRQASILKLTPAGIERAQGAGSEGDGFDFAAMFWAEDVLRPAMPSLVGVWWPDIQCQPECYRAPLGAVFPSCVGSFAVRDTEWQIGSDDELLEYMPETRLVGLDAANSSYRFVTRCVESTAELITAMADRPGVQQADFQSFAEQLGDGDLRRGRRLIHDALPSYRRLRLNVDEDRHVRYFASSFDGMPCLYLVHSAIEHVFQRDGFVQAARPGLENDGQEPGADEDDPGATPPGP